MNKPVKNRMLKPEVMRKMVNAAYSKYIKRFRSDWKKKECFRPECYGDDTSDDESGEQFVEDQIAFIGQYLGYMLLAGPHQQNLDRIRAFLDLQGGIMGQDKMEVCFMNGEPYEVYVYVHTLDDIDLADVHLATGYDTLLIKEAVEWGWTKPRLKQCVEEVREDLEYAGDKVPLKHHMFEDTLVVQCDFSNY